MDLLFFLHCGRELCELGSARELSFAAEEGIAKALWSEACTRRLRSATSSRRRLNTEALISFKLLYIRRTQLLLAAILAINAVNLSKSTCKSDSSTV